MGFAEPTSPITPPAATAMAETRPRSRTVGGTRRKDLYSLFPDADSIFKDAVLFTSSDEWGSEDASGETTPVEVTRPTSRSMVMPPTLPLYLQASPKSDSDASSKSIMERIDEDHPVTPVTTRITNAERDSRPRAASAAGNLGGIDPVVDMLPMQALDALVNDTISEPTSPVTPCRVSFGEPLSPRSPTTPPSGTSGGRAVSPTTPTPMLGASGLPSSSLPIPSTAVAPAAAPAWAPPAMVPMSAQAQAFLPSQQQMAAQQQQQMGAQQQPMAQPPMMAMQLVTLTNGQQMQVLVPVQQMQQMGAQQQMLPGMAAAGGILAPPLQQQMGMVGALGQMPPPIGQMLSMGMPPHLQQQMGMPPLPPHMGLASAQQMPNMGMTPMQALPHMAGMGGMPLLPPPLPPQALQQPQHLPNMLGESPLQSGGHMGGMGGGGGSSNGGAERLPWESWGSLAAIARDAKGSRRLQNELSRLSPAQVRQVSEELAPQVHELSKHPFGNYLVSKMAAMPSLQQTIAQGLRGHVVELITHVQGSRVVQAALLALDDASAYALADELRGHVLQCSVDTYGSWGVCVAFERCLSPWLLTEVAANIGPLSVQQQACHVVQTVLRVAAKAGMTLDVPVEALLSSPQLPQLAAHPFANYAVQIALKHAAAAQRRAIVARLLPEILTLSASKHGSNVAETLLGQASQKQLRAACSLVLSASPPRGVQQLVEHQFGNYVLQTLLRLLPQGGDGAERAKMLAAVKACATETNYGRLILSRFGEAEGAENTPPSPEMM